MLLHGTSLLQPNKASQERKDPKTLNLPTNHRRWILGFWPHISKDFHEKVSNDGRPVRGEAKPLPGGFNLPAPLLVPSKEPKNKKQLEILDAGSV